jgi:hypothetical protein
LRWFTLGKQKPLKKSRFLYFVSERLNTCNPCASFYRILL